MPESNCISETVETLQILLESVEGSVLSSEEEIDSMRYEFSNIEEKLSSLRTLQFHYDERDNLKTAIEFLKGIL